MSISSNFLRNRLDKMIELRRPLAVLSNRMHWLEIEASLAQLFDRQVRAGIKFEDTDLFGAKELISGASISNTGLPRLPTRLMVSLLYLKHAFNDSDEDFIQRWGETPTLQYFSGNEYFEHCWPYDPTLVVNFRKLLGEEGVEEILARSIEMAFRLKLISSKELSSFIADSIVQEKAIAHPTDSKLLETARVKLVEEAKAKAEGIELKQTCAKVGLLLGYKGGCYAHARQFWRMRKAIKRQSNIVGRLHCKSSRKMTALSQAVEDASGVSMYKAKRLIAQSRSKKAQVKQHKLYSWQTPEVEWISKGKSRKSYEFGVNVGIATTLKGNFILAARTFSDNSYDGYTLNEQVEQEAILMEASGMKPETANVDLGYRGVNKDNLDIVIMHRGKFKSLTAEEKKSLKRPQAIEYIIGHLKADHGMNRCHLKARMATVCILCCALLASTTAKCYA